MGSFLHNLNSTRNSNHTLPFLPWGDTPPIPGTSLSASGLLVLADLSTIAKRTVLTGTSTYFDAFVLAPGLHQQQHCEALSSALSDSTSKSIGSSPSRRCTVRNEETGVETEVRNTAMLGYLNRVVEGLKKGKVEGGKEGGGLSKGVTLKVGKPQAVGTATTTQTVARNLGLLAMRRLFSTMKERGVVKTTLGPLLYAIAPLLTALSLSLMLATRDWWGVGIICALMIARVLNIWIIRSRTSYEKKATGLLDSHCGIVCSLKGHNNAPKNSMPPSKAPGSFLPPPDTLDPVQVDNMAFDGRALVDGPGGSFSAPTNPPISNPPFPTPLEKLAEIIPQLSKTSTPATYLLNLPSSPTPIALHGVPSDMDTLLSADWMREKTNVEGYLEAIAKVLVYGVAAVSGNMKQTGNIILGGLLVISAAALALANAERGGDEGWGGKVWRVDEVAGTEADGEKEVEKGGRDVRMGGSAC